jgi:hypothetical protein
VNVATNAAKPWWKWCRKRVLILLGLNCLAALVASKWMTERLGSRSWAEGVMIVLLASLAGGVAIGTFEARMARFTTRKWWWHCASAFVPFSASILVVDLLWLTGSWSWALLHGIFAGAFFCPIGLVGYWLSTTGTPPRSKHD